MTTVRAELAKVKRYSGHVTTQTTMSSTLVVKVDTAIATVAPDRMRIEAAMSSSMPDDKPMHIVAVYDASGMRSAVQMNDMTRKVRVGVAARKDASRPFDFAYGISGLGFGPNTDLVGTLMELTGMFHFEPGRIEKRDDRDVLLFAGTLTFEDMVAKYLEHADAPESCTADDKMCVALRDGTVKMLDKQRRMDLLVDPKTMLPLGYDMPESSIAVRFSDMRWDAPVADQALAWNEGEAEDITAEVLAQPTPPAHKPTPDEVTRAAKALRP